MKPFDIKGEYTPEEVKAALAGVSGTRQLSYRYERLDKNNVFIEDIDYVQSCTIENNSLADIKRTAKMEILDTGSINYLQDRIKPYVRLAMPADKDYTSSVRELGPDVWWRFDDEQGETYTTTQTNVADGLTYNTRETAYAADSSGSKRYAATVQSGSGTNRSEFWLQFEVTDSRPLQIDYEPIGITPVTVEVFTSSALDGELIFSDSSDSGVGQNYQYPFPTRGFYYVRVSTASATLSPFRVVVLRPMRLEDSSNNGIYAAGSNLSLRAPSLVGGGYSIKSEDAQQYWSAHKLNLTHGNAIVQNFWVKLEEGVSYQESDTYIDSSGDFVYESYYTYDGSDMTFNLWLADFSGEIVVPFSRYMGQPVMVTVVYEPHNNRAALYLNSDLIGDYVDSSGAQVSDSLYDFDTVNFTYMNSYISAYDGAAYVDDMSFFFKELSANDIANMYRDGIGANAEQKRSGYVEWPQGVFVLSSPSRKMINGNSVVRTVEGYDQLVVLKEDAFPFRYSIEAGTKYTDAVTSILQTTTKSEVIPFTDTDFWTVTGLNTILTDDSYRIKVVGGTAAGAIQMEDASIILQDFIMQGKVTTPASGYSSIILKIQDPTVGGGVVNVEIVMNTTSHVVSIDVGGYYSASTYSLPAKPFFKLYYDSDLRRIVYDNSNDGATWSANISEGQIVSWEVQPTSKATVSMTSPFATPDVTYTQTTFRAIRTLNSIVQDSTSKLPTAMEWEPGTSKLSIINDLLGAINYGSATYDEDGRFVGREYILPQNRTSQFRYATDSESVITGDVTQTVDLFGVPNTWILVVSDPDRPPISGTYTNDNPLSPTSTVSRGRTVVDFRTEQNAPDQLTLDSKAQRLAFEASQVYEVIEFQTAIMPIHQNGDVYDLIIDGILVDNKYSEHSWSMTLENGAAMSHKVRKVITV